MGNPRVVVTLTTLPDRYQTLERTLNSILKQDYPLDAIYLTIPEKAARLDKIYPPLPDSITSKCQIVNIKTDYGPITKIYGALSQESDPKTIIISLDDDVIYPPDLVSSLVKHGQEHKKAAICGTGALLKYGLLFVSMVSSLNFCTWLNPFIGPTITEKGRNIDLVFGVAGVLYRRGFFPSADKLEEELFKYALNNEAVFLNDDILISAYLSKAKIKRKLFKDIPRVNCQWSPAHALSGNVVKMLISVKNAIAAVKDQGLFTQMEDLNPDETATWTIGIGILAIAVIVLLIVLFFRT